MTRRVVDVSIALLTLTLSGWAQSPWLRNHQGEHSQIEVSTLQSPWTTESYLPDLLPDPAWEGCHFDNKLTCAIHELAGSGALNCGQVREATDASDANQCAVDEFKKGKAFWIRYDGERWNNLDAPRAFVLLLTPTGKLIEIAYTRKLGLLKSSEKVIQRRCLSFSRVKVENQRVRCTPLFPSIVGTTEPIWETYPAIQPMGRVEY